MIASVIGSYLYKYPRRYRQYLKKSYNVPIIIQFGLIEYQFGVMNAKEPRRRIMKEHQTLQMSNGILSIVTRSSFLTHAIHHQSGEVLHEAKVIYILLG